MKKFYFTDTITPVLVTSIHDGHYMRDELLELTALSTDERMREEDPYTGYLAEVSENRASSSVSRFEVDLNRLRSGAIYRKPEDAWGLNLWKGELTDELSDKSLEFYDEFYGKLKEHLQKMVQAYGKVVVLDLHTYNHRRNGPYAEAADPKANPEINIGDAHNSPAFKELLGNYVTFLSQQEVNGKHPEVGQNVKFDGGGMSVWINENFPEEVCTISVEFKKTFMDEWTGVADVNHLNSLRDLVKNSIEYLEYELKILRKEQES